MTIDPARLLAHDFGERRQRYTARDAILYALGVGLGRNPTDARDLELLDERRLKVLPSFAVTLGSPGMWIADPAFGVDFKRLVHSEQAAHFHAPLPPEGEVVATAHVASLTDRGPDRGAVLTLERRVADAIDGTLYCTLTQTLLLRGDGGFGGSPPEPAKISEPDRPPDIYPSLTLSPRAALIYRLSGDWNPLHLDPGVAKAAGFARPIMQGLGTYAAAGVAVARALDVEPYAMTALSCRFAGIVLPGDTLSIGVWADDGGATFRASVGDRTVLDRGRIEFGK